MLMFVVMQLNSSGDMMANFGNDVNVKDGGSNYQRWRLHIVNNLATNPPFFSSLLGSLILATSLLFLL